MTNHSDEYKKSVQIAYDAVKELDATEEYRLTGYQIVLKSLLFGGTGTDSKSQSSDADASKKDGAPSNAEEWQSTIASKIGISPEQVGEIYHRTDDGSVELIIEGKDLPKTNSKSTMHIAALLTAGRQALGLERTTAIEIVRGVCEHYRVYDSKNFMKYVRQLGSKFRFEGSGSAVTIELTNGAFKIAGEIAMNYLEKK